ncbi:MAG: ester cyclase [Chitinophagaceae bacterium]
MNPSILKANRLLIESYFDRVWNNGELDLLDSILDKNYVNHSPGGTDTPAPGAAGLKPIVASMREAFPDLHYSIKDLVLTENRVVARVVMTGTFLGNLWGLQANGKKVEVSQINIEYLKDGKITEHWRLTDELKMTTQLSAV